MSTVLDSEQAADVRSGDAYEQLISRLSHQSVVKHFDAYADVPWDDPEYRIDPEDPRWELSHDDPLGATDWYKAQPQGVRARIGLDGIVTAMKTGLQFESVLKRGLLEYTTTLPNGASEFRYAYHEVIEEAQHSLMFQEFVNR
ncbi:MAG: diiron oxygenase, partial [Acidimicrobiia bacterium]|nr:diiron oxygenase [Acidimicrobiia bacterium]